ncbi:hypothetical protein [Streptomyces sp. NBC_01233]|uniref:hypothetical protein n=1 Tax=Streptomyces sp. NBC_01233 TaxID=2903787 RepID=UPI002E0FD30F|nr:hypothetical protein OG332_44255 [Streptomyces sp. NBC_01233]
MRNHGSNEERVGDAGITTEDIARPVPASHPGTNREFDDGGGGSADGGTPPVYPGEATADAAADEPGNLENGDVRPTDRTDRTDRTAGTGPADAADGVDEPLLGAEDTADYRKAWSEIQGRFVDDPQEAVRSADALVAEVMQTLARTFSAHKQGLEGQWGQGEQVATEELRLALQHYRSFFNRLLNT